MIGYLFWTGVGVWGNNSPVMLGLADRQLRVLDRHRPRRNADLGDPVPVPAEVAHLDQPLVGGDDHLRGHGGGLFPAIHVGRIWVIYWVFPMPNQMAHVAELQEPAALGRVRGQHLLHGVRAVLVRRPDPRPRDRSATARQARRRMVAARIYGLFAMGWHGSNRHWINYEKAYLILACAEHAAGAVGAQHRVLRLRGVTAARAGTRRSSRRTSSPARSSPASAWC